VIRDTWLSAFEINVKVTDKIAYLDGNVNTYFKKAQADTLASSVRGVREVTNNPNVYHKYSSYSFKNVMHNNAIYIRKNFGYRSRHNE